MKMRRVEIMDGSNGPDMEARSTHTALGIALFGGCADVCHRNGMDGLEKPILMDVRWMVF